MATIPPTKFTSVRESFAGIGIRQVGDPILTRVADPLVLPQEQILVSAILGYLHETMNAARKLHQFSRGLGLSAPQIGISRRIAIVHPQGDSRPIQMVNPRVVSASTKTDISFEGCLSFFDVRGEVRRPVTIAIEYYDAEGLMRQKKLDGDVARLALHEIDHLDGRLYAEIMEPGTKLIPADERYP